RSSAETVRRNSMGEPSCRPWRSASAKSVRLRSEKCPVSRSVKRTPDLIAVERGIMFGSSLGDSIFAAHTASDMPNRKPGEKVDTDFGTFTKILGRATEPREAAFERHHLFRTMRRVRAAPRGNVLPQAVRAGAARAGGAVLGGVLRPGVVAGRRPGGGPRRRGNGDGDS